MKIYQAINAVQKALLTGVKKEGKNQQQGYAFRGIDQVLNALAPALAENNLCILPRVISRVCEERLNKSGTGALFYVTVLVEFDFVSTEDGSKHTVSTYGEAMDSGDKATNKAMSAAYKYAAFQAFCIPTEDTSQDADSNTHEVQANEAIKIAREILAKYDSGDIEFAYALAANIKDADLKVAVWDVLKPHSKLRSTLKAMADEKKLTKE